MIDRTGLLESALDSLPDGVALCSVEGEVVFWNHAAHGITGYAAVELVARALPEGLEPLFFEERRGVDAGPCVAPPEGRRALVRMRHKLGHSVAVITRVLVLRDGLGQRVGAVALFHPAESLDALPHGESGDDKGADESRAEFEERLQTEFDDFERGGPAFGVLWIGVDQAESLCKTHGAAACHQMLDKVRHALAVGLRPAEQMSRWGDGEFLVLAHERTAEMLAAHAQVLTGLARTADFRWWGDRVSLTVSIGAAQAAKGEGETLAQLLERAGQAMETSSRAGGNRAILAPLARGQQPSVKESACTPS